MVGLFVCCLWFGLRFSLDCCGVVFGWLMLMGWVGWVRCGWFIVISNLDVVITLSRFVVLVCCLVVSFCLFGWFLFICWWLVWVG